MPKKAFAPITDKNSKILILGTMPGERSLTLQQYYGHKGNHFWKIIFRLFDQELSLNYDNRKALLLDKGIALWDVLASCEGEGSSDANIKNEEANDFDGFYKQHHQLKTVFFASLQAQKFYDKYVGRKSDLTYHTLPSPSSANTWKTFEQKAAEWKIILGYLN